MERIFIDFSESGDVLQKETCQDLYYMHKMLKINVLEAVRSGNVSAGPGMLWKPDCHCFRESLKATMGLCGGSLSIRGAN
jgi:hypothetical protein